MLFSSVPFLFYFLPAVLLVYFLVPKRAKNGVLLLSSLVFYGWGEPRYLPVMLVSILQGYIFGRLIERFRDTRRAKLFLVLSVLLSLGTLAYFKYADFMIANLNALTGLSATLLRIALTVGILAVGSPRAALLADLLLGFAGTLRSQHHLLHHLTDGPVGQDHGRIAVFESQVHAQAHVIVHLLHRVGGQDDHVEVTVTAALAGLEIVALRRLDRTQARTAALAIDHQTRKLRAREVAQPLAHQAHAGARRRGHHPLAGRCAAVNHVNGRDFGLRLQHHHAGGLPRF